MCLDVLLLIISYISIPMKVTELKRLNRPQVQLLILTQRFPAASQESKLLQPSRMSAFRLTRKRKARTGHPIYFGPDTLETDVTVVNPCAPTRLIHALSKPGSALAARCKEKNRKYLENAQGRGSKFAPL